MILTPLLLTDPPPGETAHGEHLEHNPFAFPRISTSSATLPTEGQAGCSAEGDSTRVAGNLLRDQRTAKQLVVGGQVSSSTGPVEAPTKEPPMATPRVAQVGVEERQYVPTRQHSL